jgi:hypothetical protein
VSGERIFTISIFALVAFMIAATTFVFSQIEPGSGVLVAALGSTLWVAFVARRRGIMRARNG